MEKTRTICSKCDQPIHWGFTEDENGTEAEVVYGHDSECPEVQE